MTTNEPVREPGTVVRDVVAAAWRDALRVERVGDDDNFFRLGGDSLTAARLAAALRTALDVRVPMSAVFEHPTVAELAAALRAEHGPALDETAEQYLTVLGYSDADTASILGRLE
ncbi:phosphopantetheine-binding protein [Micromonospora sp. DR5-3]|uniref:phosphopantetheine-binding protein n=1 Tax=unclassified Micromonospora TaxID=2617518 RepID=UPI001651F69F|nr:MULTISPECIES: phosphopantetheine-binding protein [unclassified Micromonospora]MCW3815756.1 phosphopantetheine-binding protein [Micromonospora sp. DR5-3]